MNKVTGIYSAPRQHWVGDGFPVRSMFSYNGHGKQLSPFLLLDYAGPAEFAPGTRPPGVGSHPHRGGFGLAPSGQAGKRRDARPLDDARHGA